MFGKQGVTARSFDGLGYALDSTGRFPEVVKALIISDATRWATVVSKEESERKFLNRLHSIPSKRKSDEHAKQRQCTTGAHVSV
ncbi:hypothetical protein J7J00_00685 [Bacillus sp. ISL-4]|uniref:hypothetical protein n=1 Tax=Bacillus sp. ISL-4 TaxID=2819125 RepID=UPI001BE5A60B|nr:hypothetical protein [Bacillus sp. ISL-4]MBT2664024.1 hypothetical protein [Bacillus sp. ISL-4]